MSMLQLKKRALKKVMAVILVLALSAGFIETPFLGVLKSNAAYTSELFFSEYVEGSSYNKAVEIFNGTGYAVDLSGYSIELYSNGATTASNKMNLSGTLESGKVFVVAHAQAAAEILGKANMTNSAVINFNGDDAIVLKSNGQVVDVIGQVGFRPSTEWGTGLCSTADNTLVRKSNITAGDTNSNDAFNPSLEWDGYATNDFTHLGSHVMDGFGVKVNLPPVITVSNPVTVADANTNVAITYTVTDDSTSLNSSVFFKPEGQAEYTVQTATYNNATGEYSANIPVGTLNTEYYINAADNEGLSSESSRYIISVKQAGQTALSIAEARAKADNTSVTVEGIVTGKGSKIFMQDDTAAINLYTQTNAATYQEGDRIRITGKILNYNGVMEICNFSVDEVISSGNAIPVTTLTIDQIGETYESKKIKLLGVKIGKINPASNTTLTDSENRTVPIYKVPALTGIFEGDIVDVTCFVSEYKGTYQLQVNYAGDIIKSQIQTIAEPVFYGMSPAKFETTCQTKPEISVKYEEGAKSLQAQTIELKVDNIAVTSLNSYDAAAKTGTVQYIPLNDLNLGDHDVTLTIKDSDNKAYTKSWYFTVIKNEADYHTYFGIPHAHTSFSDGQGTPSDAYAHAFQKGLDFLIITDHSNQLTGDTFDSANNQYLPKAGSEWVRTKEMADQFNSQHTGTFLAMRGFEWTHSVVGHMNALNSTNYTEAKQTMTNLGDFYKWLGKENVTGAFNHPNWPSDSFNNLAYDEAADRYIETIEAGNGAPPYSYTRSIEYYYKALDNGWHVGAVNAQDNHSENWGDPDNLTGVLAEDLTVEAFNDAVKNRRVYSTEARDTVLKMKANGYWMGSILDLDEGESLKFDISVSDASDPVEKLELVTNGGKVINTQAVNAASTTWSPELIPDSGNCWYVVKVTHTNGKISISSPIWNTGDENDLKLTELKVEPQPALPGITSSIQAQITNFGARAVNNVTVSFYQTSISPENLIGTNTITSVASGENKTAVVNWTPSASGEVKIIAKMAEIPNVTTVTELSSTVLVVTPINKNVLVDQYHGNADVPGTVGDFIKMLRTYGYKAEFNNQAITSSVLSGIDVLVLGAPGETKPLTTDENNAIASWIKSGGSLLIADKSNFGYNNRLLNPVLEAAGSGIRFNDDNVYEPEDSDKYSGGMVWSIYMENFPFAQSGLNNNMKSLRIFSGCSLVNTQGGALVNNAATGLEILLAGNSTSYNYEPGQTDQSKGTVLGPNGFMYNKKGETNGQNIPVIAKENIGNGKILAAGRHFYSDYEIVNDASNTSFTLNVMDWLSGYSRIKDIAWVRANAQPGMSYTVKGKVTSPTNLFYDSMYIEDGTGGICLYGSQKTELRLGEEVLATGVVKEFEGEKELQYQDFTNDVLYIGPAEEILPKTVTTKDIADGTFVGSLVKTTGRVTETNKAASFFKMDDGSGTAYIHVDGYLGIDIDILKAGDKVTVSGIASVGAAGPRIRVRYSSDIIKETAQDKHIIIVHTNDTHGRVKEGDGMGFAKIDTEIKELKAQNPGRVLVLDAGDTFHGQPVISISKGESMVKIMNKAGYDAMTPGNHDFNYGQDRLLELKNMADFPILSANILKADGTPLLTPYIIKEIDGVKVAMFGLTTPETLYKTNPKNIEGLTFKDPVAAAQEMVNQLKGKADVIIALTHLGLDAGSEITSEDVANAVSGIDLIVDGHSHTALPEGKAVNGTTIVQANEYGKYLGIVDMTVKADGSVSISPSLLSKEQAASITEDQEIKNLITQIEAENSVITSVVVGSTDVVLDGERNHVRSNETNLGNLIADSMREVANADVALTNGGGIRSSINAGDITKGEIITVLPFGNYVVLKEVTGAEILAALENGFSKYPAYDGRFPHVSGMKVVFDPSRPAGSRVVTVTTGNSPLDLNKVYRLATNDFTAAGGDQYTMFADNTVKGEFPALDEVLADYINRYGTSNAQKDGRVKAVTSARIAVFSDPHYFAPELGTSGTAFEAYLAQDRKLIAESSAITRSTVDAIKSSDASIVLIPGDLTKDGEKLSHEQFAAIIGELETAGKKVFVIAGNHDINNPEANQYNGPEATRVENITPDQFKSIYSSFGYSEAIAKDTNSLSYVVEPVPGLWVIAMDACLYSGNSTLTHPATAGKFNDATYTWIKQQLIEAKAQGKTVIGFMHHGILEHYTGQKQLFGEYVIDNWETVSGELADLGIKAVFTGHYHAQDIVSKKTASGNTIFDIETGSLVTYPCPYRLIDISNDTMTVNSKNITNINYNTGDKTFPVYAKDFLKTGLEGLVPSMLAGQLMAMNPALTQQEAYAQALNISGMSPAPAVTTMSIKDLLVDAMMKHYQGDEKALPQVMAVVQSMASSADPMTSTLGSSLVSLYTDLPPADNNIMIDLATSGVQLLNNPPVFAQVGIQNIKEGQTLTFKATASDDDGDTITYSSSNLPEGASIDSISGTITWTPDYTQAGSYIVSIYANDGKTLSTVDVTIIVENVNPQARAWLDNPTSTTVASEKVRVNGWALDTDGINKIEVQVDGAFVGNAVYGLARPDVFKAYPLYANTNSGFEYLLETSGLSDGFHKLTILITDVKGETTTLPERKFLVSKLPVRGYIDNPILGTALTGIVKVNGWALDYSGVSKIEVLVDNMVLGEATYGKIRLDVSAAYPQYGNSKSGFSFNLDTSKLSDGKHILKTLEYGKNGGQTVLQSKEITVTKLPLKAYIENHGIITPDRGTLNIKGWALDASGVEKIEVLIDGAVIGEAIYGDETPDLTNLYPEYGDNSKAGFHYELDTSRLSNGPHNLVIRELGKNGTFTIFPAIKYYLDNPNLQATVSGTVKVSGWCLDSSTVSKIEVLVDGNFVGEAVIGDLRPDVYAVYPEFNNQRSGFHYQLDTSLFAEGSHNIKIREYSSAGSINDIIETTINVLRQ